MIISLPANRFIACTTFSLSLKLRNLATIVQAVETSVVGQDDAPFRWLYLQALQAWVKLSLSMDAWVLPTSRHRHLVLALPQNKLFR